MPPLPPLVEPGAPLRPDETRRYSRHVLLPGIGATGQRRLKAARVACVGAGGLGSPVLTYLAAAGVGTLGVIDFDTVEESNLARQLIHGQRDLGRSKAESARDTLAEVNPHVEVRLHRERLTAGNAMEVLGGYDLVVDGSDNFATRYLVNDACVLLGVPCVWGSVLRFDGQASTFWAAHGPCYRCLHPEPPPPGSVPSCAEGGVLGVVCAAVGAAQATEVVKLVTAVGEPLVGRLQVYDALEASWREVAVRKDPACARCGPAATLNGLVDLDAACAVPDVPTVSARELRALLGGDGEVVLVDVREPAEREIVAIPGSVPIPRGAFFDGTALARLPREGRVVLHCKSGGRSAECLAVLRGAGFADAAHLDGGVLAWVRDVDPSLPSY